MRVADFAVSVGECHFLQNPNNAVQKQLQSALHFQAHTFHPIIVKQGDEPKTHKSRGTQSNKPCMKREQAHTFVCT